MAVSVSQTGEWQKAISSLTFSSSHLKRGIRKSLLQDGHYLRKQIVTGMRKQEPGGKKYKPLASTTIATRRFRGFRGRKALIRSADLRNSVSVKAIGEAVFVGALRTKRSSDGRSLANIFRVHEFGAGPIAIKITPKMRRFLHAMLSKTRATRGVGGGTGGTGVIIVSVPARPTFTPVFDKYAKPSVIRPRLLARLALNMNGALGKPAFTPPK